MPDFSLRATLLHVTFLFGLLPGYSSVSGLPAWSLSVEMQFYTLFPLVYLSSRRWPFAIVTVGLAGASLVFARLYFHGVSTGALPQFDEPSLLAFHFAKFAAGMLIYEAGRCRRPLFLAASALVLLGGTKFYGPPVALLWLAVTAMAACWYVGMPQPAARFCNSAIVTFFSNTSYAVYLIHNMLIDVVGSKVLGWALTAGAPLRIAEAALTASVLLTAYPLAYLVFRTVERAGIAAGKSSTHSRAPIAAPMV